MTASMRGNDAVGRFLLRVLSAAARQAYLLTGVK